MNYKLYSLLLVTTGLWAMESKIPGDKKTSERASTPIRQIAAAAAVAASAPLRLQRDVPKHLVIARFPKQMENIGNLEEELAQLGKIISPREATNLSKSLDMPSIYEDWFSNRTLRCVMAEAGTQHDIHTVEIIVQHRLTEHLTKAQQFLGDLIQKIKESGQNVAQSRQILAILIPVQNTLANKNYIASIIKRVYENLTNLRTICLSVQGQIDVKKHELIGELYKKFIDQIEKMRESVVILRGHTAPCVQAWGPCCVFTGDALITASQDLTARIWDVESWDTKATKPVGLKAIEESSANKKAAFQAIAASVYNNNRVKQLIYQYVGSGFARDWLCAIKPYGRSLVLSGHTARLTVAQLSPDGTYAVTGSVDGTVLCWNLVTKNAHKVMHNGPISKIEFIAGNTSSYQCCTQTARGEKRIWDLKTGKIAQHAKNHALNREVITFDALGLDADVVKALNQTPDLSDDDQCPD